MSSDNLQFIVDRLINSLKRDVYIQIKIHNLRESLKADRVILYYFYRQWKGQVTSESVSSEDFSILGSTGPDECFNEEYATLYQEGRVRAISDIETEPIQECHRKFLRNLKVRANLSVPVLTNKGLWGLLIAHQCQGPHFWLASDVELMQREAYTLAAAPTIQDY